ncbi:uncharacterized protein K444DRAFT_615089 [Hyaloscypha bicolor E]|uniref:Uncharacterized protein n=1 Tax=Hyaloscypha bicolor E TaxID=1095630 RepID=A0A2J6T442_9HELO|nr:uncharacterized protein K444DRAFT_615089 [Hyaloscypha bicolor E]PMD57693.1 hypothetical protein K444DRAFT_615089 [Hyaloscypha bicolor E]
MVRVLVSHLALGKIGLCIDPRVQVEGSRRLSALAVTLSQLERHFLGGRRDSNYSWVGGDSNRCDSSAAETCEINETMMYLASLASM